MRDLENPMVIGDYYEQLRLVATCNECGKPIYEGDRYHVIGKHGSTVSLRVCDDCHQTVRAEYKEDE